VDLYKNWKETAQKEKQYTKHKIHNAENKDTNKKQTKRISKNTSRVIRK